MVENRPGSEATREMLLSKFAGEPRLRYVEERRRGASRARNAGLAVAEGDIVAFLDDDVVVDAAWLDHCVEAFEAADDIACVTGMILPLTLESQSQLLLEQFASFGKGFRRKVYRLPDAACAGPTASPTPRARSDRGRTPRAEGGGARAGRVRRQPLGRGRPPPAPRTWTCSSGCCRPVTPSLYEPGALVRTSTQRHQAARAPGVPVRSGMGALLGKQLVRGPERSRLCARCRRGCATPWIPGPARTRRSPRVPAQAGLARAAGNADRAARLSRERALGSLRRPLSQLRGGSTPAYTAWLAPRGAKPIELRVFADRAPPREAGATRTQRWLVMTAAAACVAAPLLVVLGAPAIVRLPAVLALMCLAPGTAFLAAVRRRAELGLVLGVSLAVTVVVAECMIWLHAWWPTAWLLRAGGRLSSALGGATGALRCRGRSLPTAALGGARRTGSRDPDTLLCWQAVLLLWASPLVGTDVSRIAGLGLLDALPPTYYVALGAAARGLPGRGQRARAPRTAARRLRARPDPRHPRNHAAPLRRAALRVDLQAPRRDRADRIDRRVDRKIDIYNNWPGFFAANAWFSSVAGCRADRLRRVGAGVLQRGERRGAAVRAARADEGRDGCCGPPPGCSCSGTGSVRTTSRRRRSASSSRSWSCGLCLRRVPNPRVASLAGGCASSRWSRATSSRPCC